ncbi:excisionase family DNA-binding protein [Candidatus Eisenbacteria bacterium]|uniref:Excisionase family DNA-binding protein n=1 Tax=Eiseniibacteriota bacterium TaxID=2212470 RepID=A0ABV6YK89_UNCEI
MTDKLIPSGAPPGKEVAAILGTLLSGIDGSEAFTPQQVCKALGISIRTIYRMIHRGEIGAVRAGRLWRIPATSLETYLKGSRPSVSDVRQLLRLAKRRGDFVDLLKTLRERGITVSVEGFEVLYDGPDEQITPELEDRIKHHGKELRRFFGDST